MFNLSEKIASFKNQLIEISRGKDESVLGIDIGSSAIKIVQLRKRGAIPLLETYGSLALGPYMGVEIGRAVNMQNATITQALADLLREARTTTKICGVSIPSRSSMVVLIEVPNVSPAQLQAIIPLEARKHIPVPITEVTLDWTVLPNPLVSEKETAAEDTNNKAGGQDVAIKMSYPATQSVEVLLGAIHNEVFENFRTMVTKLRLIVKFYEVEIFSASRAVSSEEVAPVMIFDLGASLTKFYIVERDIIRASHVISRGSQDITLSMSKALSISVSEAEEIKRTEGLHYTINGKSLYETIPLNIEYLLAEAKKMIAHYQRKRNKVVSRIVMIGGGARMPGLLGILQSNIETDVEIANPFSKIETPAFMEEALRDAGPEFAVATGLALRYFYEQA